MEKILWLIIMDNISAFSNGVSKEMETLPSNINIKIQHSVS